MHHRLSPWIAIFVLVLGTLRAQVPATPASGPSTTPKAAMQEGQIIAAKVVGTVSMVLKGATTELHNGDKVSQSATIITAVESSVVLVFSNGATTQLGADTTLVIEEFMQDPFQGTLSPANMAAEPTTSHTKLRLNKGELVGKVSKLKHDQGSYYSIQTPVGAAGIRGTTFRIVFRPSGTGQAFAVFSLSTVEGNVNFQQGGANAQTTPNGQPAGGTEGQPGTPGQPQGQGTGGQQGNGVAVTGGQEVVVTVSVEVNPTTGAVTVTSPPTITSTQPISVETQTQITQTAVTLVTAASETTFSSSSSGSSGSTTPSQGTTPTDESQKQDNSQKSDNSSSGNTTGGSSESSGTGSQGSGNSSSGETGGGTSKTYTPPSPPPVVPLPKVTPGAG